MSVELPCARPAAACWGRAVDLCALVPRADGSPPPPASVWLRRRRTSLILDRGACTWLLDIRAEAAGAGGGSAATGRLSVGVVSM